VIAKIRLLSIDQLHRVESFLAHLECGNSSPLSLGEGVRLASDGMQQDVSVVGGVESGDESPPSKTKSGDLSPLLVEE
jgi:hypothetical protein